MFLLKVRVSGLPLFTKSDTLTWEVVLKMWVLSLQHKVEDGDGQLWEAELIQDGVSKRHYGTPACSCCTSHLTRRNSVGKCIPDKLHRFFKYIYAKMLQRCIRVCNCCVKHCTTTYEPHNEWLNDNCFNFLFNFHTRIYMFTGMQDTWYIFPIVSTTPHTPHSNSNNRYFLYSAILPEKLIRCALHIHTSSDDHHGVHLYNAVTPCYCSMLGAFSRLVSFGACC